VNKFAAVLLLALGLSTPSLANPDFDLGPATGVTAPSIGTPSDQTGAPRSLQSLTGEKGLVLFFFRSAVWCPYCQAQLIDLNSGAAELTRRGYRLAGISYDKPEANAGFAAKWQIQYPLLSDPGSVVIDRFGLRDPQYKPGSIAYGVPRPIIFILDTKGVIKAKLYEETYKTRPPAALVIQTTDRLAAGG
jgi:peroxiredoxin